MHLNSFIKKLKQKSGERSIKMNEATNELEKKLNTNIIDMQVHKFILGEINSEIDL